MRQAKRAICAKRGLLLVLALVVVQLAPQSVEGAPGGRMVVVVPPF